MKDRPYIQLYNTMILQTRRGTSRNGGVINAKPIFVLALIEVIRRGVFSNNKILFNNDLKDVYNGLYSKFNPNLAIAPVYLPFYFLTNDGYWHIKWIQEPPPTYHPSAKMLKGNAEYGFLDNALWDLLQEEEVRQYYENQIISFFLTA